MSRWEVAKHYGIWYAIEHGWKSYQGFTTWAEAMAYADRKSQPALGITIKDPSGQFCDLTATKREYVHLKSGGDRFTLMPHEWKPLAEFLLEVAKNGEEE